MIQKAREIIMSGVQNALWLLYNDRQKNRSREGVREREREKTETIDFQLSAFALVT